MPFLPSQTTLLRLQQQTQHLQPPPPTTIMSLCFLTAFTKLKSGAITQQEYTEHLLAHLRGTRHPEDAAPRLEPLANFEPWAAALRDIALTESYQPLSDTSTHALLFSHSISGNLPAFTSTLTHLRTTYPTPDILQPAACLAAQQQHLPILAYCVDEQGAEFDRYLTRAAQLGAKGSVPFLEWLLERNWAGIRDDEDAVVRQIKHFGEESMEAEWLRRNAGRGAEGGKKDDGGAEAPKGKDKPKSGTKDPKQGYTPEQIQDWFGDVPW
ncbi:hypothetical protein NX059_005978 [Plenodomus lindquistii]|nr:hypothetical protein NX059_005978 [Plenodomus lindquistii]